MGMFFRPLIEKIANDMSAMTGKDVYDILEQFDDMCSYGKHRLGWHPLSSGYKSLQWRHWVYFTSEGLSSGLYKEFIEKLFTHSTLDGYDIYKVRGNLTLDKINILRVKLNRILHEDPSITDDSFIAEVLEEFHYIVYGPWEEWTWW
jgi:hypothetical protein